MYEFRAYNSALKQWIYGKGIKQSEDGTVSIFNSEGEWVCPKAQETVGRKIVLEDSTRTVVYQGDIIRYSFTHAGEIYHRYLCIKESSTEVWAEELWRDYDMDCETFTVDRFHNVKYSGTRKDITSFNLYKPVKVVGNIWQNPELL